MNDLAVYLLGYCVVATFALILEWAFAEAAPVDHTADLDAELRLLIESEDGRG